ncbi:MAG TPA: hypothetical protein VKE40_00070 [Gemmataceae bacterium]|nr:hypothetical protein [Gemmataceae bacterium]
MHRLRAACLLALLPAGCVTRPLLDNPMRLPGAVAGECAHPPATHVDSTTELPPGEAYRELFERVLDAVDDYFPIAYANRYEGRVLGRTTFAPGYEQPWRPGSPDKYDRLLATLQPYRYRCEVRIREAEPSGYFVEVVVRKELKDYAAPSGQFTGVPIYGDIWTVDRDHFFIVDPDVTAPLSEPGERWIPKGRETAIEQAILRKLQQCP